MSKGKPLAAKLGRAAKSDKTSQKRRAAHMISKFAGSHWREAQRAKWIIDMVTAIDNEYRHGVEAQRKHIDALDEELSRVYKTMEAKDSENNAKCRDLEEELRKVKFSNTKANQQVLASEAVIRGLEGDLNLAEQSASMAKEECAELRQEVTMVSEAGSRVRRNLANRAHLLREDLLRTKCNIRQKRKSIRDKGVELCRVQADNRNAMDEAKQSSEILQEEKELLTRKISQLSVDLIEARNMADHAANLMGKCYRPDGGTAQESSHLNIKGEGFDICGAEVSYA